MVGSQIPGGAPAKTQPQFMEGGYLTVEPKKYSVYSPTTVDALADGVRYSTNLADESSFPSTMTVYAPDGSVIASTSERSGASVSFDFQKVGDVLIEATTSDRGYYHLSIHQPALPEHDHDL